jgi:UDP-N-acetyl-D-mannosaminuronic acid transferase (WecB/TagA/CpsF family)
MGLGSKVNWPQSPVLAAARGQAAVFASRLTRNHYSRPQRRHRFHPSCFQAGGPHGLRFFLLGAHPGSQCPSRTRLEQGPSRPSDRGPARGCHDEEEKICDQINAARPDVIWVGFSVPLEYEFSVRNKTRLKAGWLVTCGGAIAMTISHIAERAVPGWRLATGALLSFLPVITVLNVTTRRQSLTGQ